MAYATNSEFGDRSGLGLRIPRETVGTGGASGTQSFDLDNDNIISGSYTFSYGTAGSNELKDLTETTDYVFDKESGEVYLTGTGAVVINQDILYATYTYTDDFSDATISDFLNNATSQVDKLTGRRWTTGTSITEYRDGRRNMSKLYPTTDRPYVSDWDAPDKIVLKKFPVTKIDNVYFLSNPISISKFFNYDDNLATYTDKTDEVNSSSETPFTLFAATPAADDYVYIGSSQRFFGLDINLATNGTGTPAIDWEYYNGSAWADITESETDSGSSTFTASGKFTWSFPWGWTRNDVNSVSNYWIRGKVATSYTIAPICATMTIQDSISLILEPRQILFKNNGILNFMGVNVPDGQQNIRIDYFHGMSSTPDYITELTIMIAALQAFINLTGGSYNDATSYNVGSKSVTIGEQYVNIREVIKQYKERINELLQLAGKRADVVVI